MGKSKGKKAGKILLTVGSFFLGAGGIGQHIFGMVGHSFGAGIMAASLVGTVWNVAASRKMGNSSSSSPSIQRFDKAQESMSGDGQIPVVYGMRKISGNQTYHWTNAEQNTLRKHVVLCEGGIEGIVSVCANDLLIPTGEQATGTVFTIQNVKYADAKVWKDGKTLHLYANGEDKSIYLCNKGDAERADTFYEWQANTGSLISYINRMNMGWQAFPYATTSRYPGDLKVDAQDSAYMRVNSVTADTVTGGTKYTFHDNEPPENYEEVGGYPNMAWLDMTFQTSQELNGNPSVDCIIKGRKIYDPRTKRTAYSNNPALCVLDFLTNKRYGLGRWVDTDDIDMDSFIEAANYCDEEITVYDANDTPLKSKRYELNMVIDARQDASQWLQDMLANFCAWLVISKDKIKLLIERESPIVHKFNDDNITSMTITPVKASDTPNRYEVSLCDPETNWRVVQVISSDYADQKQRGKIITKSVELSGVTSQSQALRLARFYSDYNLSCPIVVSFTTGIEAMALEPGDVISVSYRDAFNEMPVRISEIKETEDNEFEITARQYNGDIYGDYLGGGIQTKNYTVARDPSNEDSVFFTLSNVKNLRAISQHRKKEDGSVAYDILVSFDLPTQYVVDCAKVYYKANNAPSNEINYFKEGVPADELGYQGEWKCAGSSTKTVKIPNVKIGDIYRIRTAVRSKKGTEQSLEDCPEVICRVTKRETIPAQPHNLTYDFTHDFTFSWSDVEDSDVSCYELRTDKNKSNVIGMLAKVVAPSATVKLGSRSGKAYVYALNAQGKYSYPASCDWSYPKPDAPESMEFTETPRGMNIKLPFFPARVKKAVLYITGTKTSDKIEVSNPIYEFKGDPDIYSVRACFVDLLGEGYASQEYTFTINPTFKEEWIADESISLEKVNKTIKDAVADAQEAIPRLNGIDTDILNINEDITELQKTDGEIKSTITQINKETQEKFASQLKQTADSITSTVAANKKTADDKDAELASQIKQTSDSLTSTFQKKIDDVNTDISQIKQTATSLSSTVQSNKTATDTEISNIKQTASKLATTVQDNKKAADGSISGLSSQITQEKNRITSIITNLGKSPSQSGYSALTQLQDGINARVVKTDFTGKNIINQINMTATGTTIDGQYLHVTGTTKFDSNIIANGMIKAGAITADKLTTGTLSLTGNQGIKGGAAVLSASGLTVNMSSGGSVCFDSAGMSFKDKNGQTFSAVGRFLTGTAQNGQYVRFTKEWDVTPNIILIPLTTQTAVASFSNADVYTKCYAENVTKAGFVVRCYSYLAAGANGRMTVGHTYRAYGPTGGGETSYTYQLPIPKEATSATVYYTASGDAEYGHGGTSAGTYSYTIYKTEVTLHWYVNGSEVTRENNGVASFSFARGSTIKVKAEWTKAPEKKSAGYLSINTVSLNTSTDYTIASNTAAFIVTDSANKQYTIG